MFFLVLKKIEIENSKSQYVLRVEQEKRFEKIKNKTKFSHTRIQTFFFERNEINKFGFKRAFLPTSTPLCIFFDFPIQESNKNQNKIEQNT